MKQLTTYYVTYEREIMHILQHGIIANSGVELLADESYADVYAHRRYGITEGIAVFAVDSRGLIIDQRQLSRLIADNFFFQLQQRRIPTAYVSLIGIRSAGDVARFPDNENIL